MRVVNECDVPMNLFGRGILCGEWQAYDEIARATQLLKPGQILSFDIRERFPNWTEKTLESAGPKVKSALKTRGVSSVVRRDGRTCYVKKVGSRRGRPAKTGTAQKVPVSSSRISPSDLQPSPSKDINSHESE
jgi:hypothetical protein